MGNLYINIFLLTLLLLSVRQAQGVSLRVVSASDAIVQLNGQTNLQVTVVNESAEPLVSLDFVLIVNKVKTGETHVDLTEPVEAFGSECILSLPVSADAEAGSVAKQVSITKVNGGKNESAENKADFTLLSVTQLEARRVVMEEYTGLWCGFCPKGEAAVNRMSDEFGERFIAFSIHSGDVLEIGEDSAKIIGKVQTGTILVDGLGVGDVGNIVIRDRQRLAEDGIIVVVMTLEGRTNELLAGPDIVSRGFVYVRESEGLLLMTNDGAFANMISHPSTHFAKTYRVTVRPRITEEQLTALTTGVIIDGRRSMPAAIHVIKSEQDRTVLEIVLEEGRNRQIRKMCEAVGLEVARLKRNAIGPVKLGMLQPGKWRELTKEEMRSIKSYHKKLAAKNEHEQNFEKSRKRNSERR